MFMRSLQFLSLMLIAPVAIGLSQHPVGSSLTLGNSSLFIYFIPEILFIAFNLFAYWVGMFDSNAEVYVKAARKRGIEPCYMCSGCAAAEKGDNVVPRVAGLEYK